jgi:hypothetical protein
VTLHCHEKTSFVKKVGAERAQQLTFPDTVLDRKTASSWWGWNVTIHRFSLAPPSINVTVASTAAISTPITAVFAPAWSLGVISLPNVLKPNAEAEAVRRI